MSTPKTTLTPREIKTQRHSSITRLPVWMLLSRGKSSYMRRLNSWSNAVSRRRTSSFKTRELPGRRFSMRTNSTENAPSKRWGNELRMSAPKIVVSIRSARWSPCKRRESTSLLEKNLRHVNRPVKRPWLLRLSRRSVKPSIGSYKRSRLRQECLSKLTRSDSSASSLPNKLERKLE